MSRFKSMIGEKHGMLSVIERVENQVYSSGTIRVRYRCKCDCGNEVIVEGHSLSSGNTVSCGCYRKNRLKKPNEYTIDGQIVRVETNKGTVLLDVADLEIVKTKRIYVDKCGYALIEKTKALHRYIMGEDKKLIDHINHNKLDNRRSNLRVCDYSINGINKKCMSNTGYIGISRRKDGNYMVTVDRKYCGISKSLAEAIKLREQNLDDSRLLEYNTYVAEGKA